MKTKKTKEAVSLIVLVLTIVIMIILAGVIVINLNNSGIIDRAKGAVSETNLKNMQELANVAWGEAYLAIKGEKTPELIKSTMLEKLKGKGVSEEELGKYTFNVTNGGVEVAVKTEDGTLEPEEPQPEPDTPVEPEEPEEPTDPLNPSGIIPEGAVYYRYDEVPLSPDFGDMCYLIDLTTIDDEATAYTAGMEFPSETLAGDVYIYDGYMYVYESGDATLEFEANHWYIDGEGMTCYGWGASWIGSGVVDKPLLESINGEELGTLFGTYAECELEILPVIPAGVKNMDCTFLRASGLASKTITINATPDSCYGCFYDADAGTLEIIGDSKNKEELLATIDENPYF